MWDNRAFHQQSNFKNNFLVKIFLDGFLIFCQLKVTLSNILSAWSIIDLWLSLNLQLQLLLIKHTVELLNFSWLGKHSFYIIIRKNMYVWQTRLRLQQLLLTREQVFYQSPCQISISKSTDCYALKIPEVDTSAVW